MAPAHPESTAPSPPELSSLTQIPIAQLTPQLERLETRTLKVIVTLTWPFSSATGSVAFLLAEPDFRLRKSRGQVRVQFCGSSARFVKEGGIASGDEVLLCLEGAEFVTAGIEAASPGRGVEFELRFTERLKVEWRREMRQDVHTIDIDHPPPEPAVEERPPSPVREPEPIVSIYPRTRRREDDGTPHGNKRRRVTYGSGPLYNGGDLFLMEDGSPAGSGKRSVRLSSTWRFSSRSPSPEVEEVLERELEDSSLTVEEVLPTPVMVDEGIQTDILDDLPESMESAGKTTEVIKSVEVNGTQTETTVQARRSSPGEVDASELPQIALAAPTSPHRLDTTNGTLQPPDSPNLLPIPSDSLPLVSPIAQFQDNRSPIHGISPPDDREDLYSASPIRANGGPEARVPPTVEDTTTEPMEEVLFKGQRGIWASVNQQRSPSHLQQVASDDNELRVGQRMYAEEIDKEDPLDHEIPQPNLNPDHVSNYSEPTKYPELPEYSEDEQHEIQSAPPLSQYPDLPEQEIHSPWRPVANIPYPELPALEQPQDYEAYPGAKSTVMSRSHSAQSAALDLTETDDDGEQQEGEYDEEDQGHGMFEDQSDKENENVLVDEDAEGEEFSEEYDQGEYGSEGEYEEDEELYVNEQPTHSRRFSDYGEQGDNSDDEEDEEEEERNSEDYYSEGGEFDDFEADEGMEDEEIYDEEEDPQQPLAQGRPEVIDLLSSDDEETAEVKTARLTSPSRSPSPRLVQENMYYSDEEEQRKEEESESDEEIEEDAQAEGDGSESGSNIVKEDEVRAVLISHGKVETATGTLMEIEETSIPQNGEQEIAGIKDIEEEPLEADNDILDSHVHEQPHGLQQIKIQSTTIIDMTEPADVLIDDDNHELSEQTEARIYSAGETIGSAAFMEADEIVLADAMATTPIPHELRSRSGSRPPLENIPSLLPEHAPVVVPEIPDVNIRANVPGVETAITQSLTSPDLDLPSPVVALQDAEQDKENHAPTSDGEDDSEAENELVIGDPASAVDDFIQHRFSPGRDGEIYGLDGTHDYSAQVSTEQQPTRDETAHLPLAYSSSIEEDDEFLDAPSPSAQLLQDFTPVHEDRALSVPEDTQDTKLSASQESTSEKDAVLESFTTAPDESDNESQIEVAVAESDPQNTELQVVIDQSSTPQKNAETSTSPGEREDEGDGDALTIETRSGHRYKIGTSPEPAVVIDSKTEEVAKADSIHLAPDQEESARVNPRRSQRTGKTISSQPKASRSTTPLHTRKSAEPADKEFEGLSPILDNEKSSKGHDASVELALSALDSPTKHTYDLRTNDPTMDLKLRLFRNLRTELAEYTGLKVLRYHLNKTLDILAIATTPTPDEHHQSASGLGHYHTTFHITDASTAPAGVTEVTISRPFKEALPVVKAGDGVLLRNFVVHASRDKGFVLRSDKKEACSWAVFKEGEEEPEVRGPPVEYDLKEKNHIKALKEWYRSLDTESLAKIVRANRAKSGGKGRKAF